MWLSLAVEGLVKLMKVTVLAESFYFIYFRALSAPAMSTDMSHVKCLSLLFFLKYILTIGGKVLIRQMEELFRTVWDEEHIPEEWQKNVIIPIHKKGATSNCENYRAISLSSIVFKVFTRILENRLRS
jgi:hypothetical protein